MLILPRDRWPALLDAATCVRDRALLSVLAWVGPTIGETVALDVRDVRLSDEELRIGGRGAYAHPCCLQELAAYLLERPEPRADGNPLFVSERRGRLCAWRAREIVQLAGAAIGCPDLHPRTLRISTAAALAERGASLEAIADQLGYSETRKAAEALRRHGIHARSAPDPQTAKVASWLRSCWSGDHSAPHLTFGA